MEEKWKIYQIFSDDMIDKEGGVVCEILREGSEENLVVWMEVKELVK